MLSYCTNHGFLLLAAPLVILSCGSPSDSNVTHTNVSCFLGSSDNRSCWEFALQGDGEVATIKSKCEDGSSFGSEGVFANRACTRSQSLATCSVVFEGIGPGTLYFYPNWSVGDSRELCSEILSGEFEATESMALAQVDD